MTASCTICGTVVDGGAVTNPYVLIGLDDAAKRERSLVEYGSLAGHVFMHLNKFHADATVRVHAVMALAGHCEAMKTVISSDPDVKLWQDGEVARLLDLFPVEVNV